MATAIARPSTPEGRCRDDDPIFSTPTSKADLGLKLALIQQRHYANVPEPTTPTCGADVERELVAMKKQQDDFFDDYAFIMRKAGKWMDEQNGERVRPTKGSGGRVGG
ncbi:hypothetical protein BHE90_001388 [Fusarium euwallaceae]|uniref:Uncharacterized protein n=1 Tax=Fusarium euwallaceae TaxID=1147111 RepID=A0A430M840_9HYPO|nr:hypothetical protein BHE90_001388 [Fusarium euwallaceae]